ncbi:indole-3-glycerol phosphate synthase TrpC [Bacillus sp. FJAT-29790]|uniref:indole-3-glycerol phosphate synthase TrpC n=1 Tax=Bacillus sp. FJAT-29790 TaxID=1895002 RepID=UPI001C239577|nr:indole-3-glycerol phosphate synthase TrpC [Bacillus sp. FJAT-29790]MBU8877997.1 indole-3-glycerol phosphate synthase TrpC [Bacillus sp. FJAT-29790]
MTTILDTILEEKKREVHRLKDESGMVTSSLNLPKRSFLSKLEKAQQLSIIAEFKRASPSKGEINMALNPEEQAKSYTDFGADAISVLTDTSFFKGSFSDLTAVSEAVDVPVLCKDFIIDETQIIQAKKAGANLILLIAAAMDASRLKELYEFALAQDLEVLMEVHNEEEVEKALKTGTRLIGVNNRNLKTFDVDLAVTERLATSIKKAGAFLISESGIKTEEDVKRVIAAGANGILVGEAFMLAANLEKLLKGMKLPLNEVVQQ